MWRTLSSVLRSQFFFLLLLQVGHFRYCFQVEEQLTQSSTYMCQHLWTLLATMTKIPNIHSYWKKLIWKYGMKHLCLTKTALRYCIKPLQMSWAVKVSRIQLLVEKYLFLEGILDKFFLFLKSRLLWYSPCFN